jgi:hypothetical protein
MVNEINFCFALRINEQAMKDAVELCVSMMEVCHMMGM